MPVDPILATSPTPYPGSSTVPPAVAPKAQSSQMHPGRVELRADGSPIKPSGSNGHFYDADVLRNQLSSAHMAAAGITAARAAGPERVGSIAGELGSRAVSVTSDAVSTGLPIVGEALGAAGIVLTMQSRAGNAGEDLPSATWRQNLNAISDRIPHETHTAYPGTRVDVGLSHTALPAFAPGSIRDSVYTTPMETSMKPLHKGHAAPDLAGLQKPTGTAIHQANAADQATLAKRENIVTPAHAAHLTPSGTLANADKAIIDVNNKVNGYFLNSHHVDGMHKARVFKSALGYDAANSQGLVEQIREGVQLQRAIPGRASKFGDSFGVDIPVTGPNGTATVRTGWNYDPGSKIPRLITAVVK